MDIDKILLKIRNRRQELNYSQEYIAMRLNISQGSYNKLENGITNLNLKQLKDLSEILKFDIRELF